MSPSGYGSQGPWRLRSGPRAYEFFLARTVTHVGAEQRVPSEHVSWLLDGWLASARGTMLEMYAALGGLLPWGLTSLERGRQEPRIRERLLRALEHGELVTLRVEEPVAAWSWPEPLPPVSPEPEVPPPPAAVVEPAPLFADPARQAATLRQAAAQGVPFCAECERRRKARAAAA
jgi:hypothetical protein